MTVTPPASVPGNAVDAPRSAPTTVRIAMWSARHRWLVFVLWFVATLGVFGLDRVMGGIRTQNATGNGGVAQTEAAQGASAFNNAIGQQIETDQTVVVVTSPTLKVTDPSFQAGIADVVGRLRAITSEGATVFSDVVDPLQQPPALGLVSPDLTSVRLTATGPDAVIGEATDTIRDGIAAIRAAHPELVIHAVSSRLFNDDINDVVFEDLDRSLLLTIPATFAILLIAFGAFAAAVVPLVLALTSLLAAFGLLGIYSKLFNPVSPYATQLVVLIGLAVAIDYSLFMITRFRSERRRGHDTLVAIEIATSTAGRAVFFSGLAVMISVAALYVLPDELFHSMALGHDRRDPGRRSIGSLTFLPAVLAILGRASTSAASRTSVVSVPRRAAFWSRIVTRGHAAAG